MGLFERFNETIFLKTDSDLEKRIAYLKEHREEVINKDRIDLDIKLLELGLKGEKEIEFELKNANIGMYVLHDITLSYDDLTAQIDYVVVTPAKCYLIECKNLVGDITINANGEFQRAYKMNGKIHKEAIYSPYNQAMRHVEILRKRYIENNSKLTVALFENSVFNDKYYKPLVVLANSTGKLNNRYAPKWLKDKVVRSDNLINYFKQDMAKTSSNAIDSRKDMEKLALHFLEINTPKEVDYLAKYQLKLSSNDTLKDVKLDDTKLIDKLKDFRLTKSHTMKVPAYYIFTNDELELLVSKKPTTIEELKSLNILTPIKVRCHGEEIVNIIKETMSLP